MQKMIEGSSFENIPSYDKVVWVRGTLVRCELLKPNELRLMLIILSLKGAEQIFIKHEYMALRMGGCSVDKIKDILNKLCELNLISKKGRRTTRGRFTTNIYTLADIDEWLKERKLFNRSRTELYQPFVYSDMITDNELRLFAVIKSLEGYDNILLATSQLLRYNNCDKKTLLRTRKSLIDKKLISYERRGSTIEGNQTNEYFWSDEREWFESNYILNNEEEQ